MAASPAPPTSSGTPAAQPARAVGKRAAGYRRVRIGGEDVWLAAPLECRRRSERRESRGSERAPGARLGDSRRDAGRGVDHDVATKERGADTLDEHALFADCCARRPSASPDVVSLPTRKAPRIARRSASGRVSRPKRGRARTQGGRRRRSCRCASCLVSIPLRRAKPCSTRRQRSAEKINRSANRTSFPSRSIGPPTRPRSAIRIDYDRRHVGKRQKRFTEHLLCEDCEAHFSSRETHFANVRLNPATRLRPARPDERGVVVPVD